MTDPGEFPPVPDRSRRTWAGLAAMVADGRWATVADLLVDLATDDETLDVAEEAVAHLLGHGRVVSLTEALSTKQRLPLLLRLLEAEVGVRLWEVRAYELEALRSELEVYGRGDWWLWATALTAEHYLWLGDLSAFTIASTAFAGMDAEDDRPFAVLARGKLRRILAVGALYLSSGADASGGADQMRSAIEDFEATGNGDEVIATEVVVCLVRSMVQREQAPQQIERVRRAASAARALRSDRLVEVLVVWAWIGVLAWDFDAVDAALGEFDMLEGRLPKHHVDLRDAVGLVSALVRDDASRFELAMRMGGLARSMRRGNTLLEGICLYLTALLLDAGHVELALEVVPDLFDDAAGVGRITHLDRRTLIARFDILQKPGVDSVEAFEDVLAQVEASGPLRPAAVVALRGALDCARTGLVDDARRLRDRGLAILPGPPERTARERHFVGLIDSVL